MKLKAIEFTFTSGTDDKKTCSQQFNEFFDEEQKTKTIQIISSNFTTVTCDDYMYDTLCVIYSEQ